VTEPEQTELNKFVDELGNMVYLYCEVTKKWKQIDIRSRIQMRDSLLQLGQVLMDCLIVAWQEVHEQEDGA
jgi:hypothetical protein